MKLYAVETEAIGRDSRPTTTTVIVSEPSRANAQSAGQGFSLPGTAVATTPASTDLEAASNAGKSEAPSVQTTTPAEAKPEKGNCSSEEASRKFLEARPDLEALLPPMTAEQRLIVVRACAAFSRALAIEKLAESLPWADLLPPVTGDQILEINHELEPPVSKRRPGRPAAASRADGEAIRKFRQGFTQADVAAVSKLNISTIQNAEYGGLMTGKTLDEIAGAISRLTGMPVSKNDITKK